MGSSAVPKSEAAPKPVLGSPHEGTMEDPIPLPYELDPSYTVTRSGFGECYMTIKGLEKEPVGQSYRLYLVTEWSSTEHKDSCAIRIYSEDRTYGDGRTTDYTPASFWVNSFFAPDDFNWSAPVTVISNINIVYDNGDESDHIYLLHGPTHYKFRDHARFNAAGDVVELREFVDRLANDVEPEFIELSWMENNSHDDMYENEFTTVYLDAGILG